MKRSQQAPTTTALLNTRERRQMSQSHIRHVSPPHYFPTQPLVSRPAYRIQPVFRVLHKCSVSILHYITQLVLELSRVTAKVHMCAEQQRQLAFVVGTVPIFRANVGEVARVEPAVGSVVIGEAFSVASQ